MQKQTYQIEINAPAQIVWDAITDSKKYRIWTYAFNKDSHFKGGWNKGDSIHFVGCDDETGKLAGMVSRIEDSIPYEYISIKHLGILKDGVEDFDSEEVKKWAPSYENYTLSQLDNGGTLFKAEVDMDPEYAEMFETMWVKGLKLIKLVCESMFQVQVTVNKPINEVWEKFTNPEYVTKWNFASSDWECPKATNELKIDGKFSYTMAAKDGSVSFDFNGQYFDLKQLERISYRIEGGRIVYIYFEEVDGGVTVTELVQKEDQNPIELQQTGWQSILENFKLHCEG